ncbi:MAG: hypothetical protein MZW92_06175, partial [Comamonadaceae bacterium]|nr:hypothetical protein [Comamonadaceae bacterium]
MPSLLATLGCPRLLGCGPGAPGLDLVPRASPGAHAGHDPRRAEAALRAPTARRSKVGWSPDAQAAAPAAWSPGRELVLPPTRTCPGRCGCPRGRWASTAPRPRASPSPTRSRRATPPPAGEPGSTAVALDDPSVARLGQRGGLRQLRPRGRGGLARARVGALGPAEGLATEVVSLGEGGRITLELRASRWRTGPARSSRSSRTGWTMASSSSPGWRSAPTDGPSARFDCATLAARRWAPTSAWTPAIWAGWPASTAQGFGTPFDLGELAVRPEVLDGRLDLGAVRYVRIEDVVPATVGCATRSASLTTIPTPDHGQRRLRPGCSGRARRGTVKAALAAAAASGRGCCCDGWPAPGPGEDAGDREGCRTSRTRIRTDADGRARPARAASEAPAVGCAEVVEVAGEARAWPRWRRCCPRAVGVQVRRLGGLGSFGLASIRGSSAAQVPIYLDGLLLNAGGLSAVDLGELSLDTELLKKVVGVFVLAICLA